MNSTDQSIVDQFHQANRDYEHCINMDTLKKLNDLAPKYWRIVAKQAKSKQCDILVGDCQESLF